MKYKVLAVDDHHETLDIIVMTLQSYGYEAVYSNSPVEALELASTELPDLALVDVNMPVMSGLEVVRRLRTMPIISEIPIIMFTAEDHPDQKKAGFAAGVDDYLVKPIPPDEMIARIEEMLEGVQPHAAMPDQGTMVMPSTEEVTPVAEPQPHEKQPEQGVLAVLGVRGGVGTTTVALNLAAILSGSGRQTTLLDLDIKQGHVALYLNTQPTKSMTVLAEKENLSAQHIVSQVMAYGKRLRLLLAESNINGRLQTITPAQTNLILDTLHQNQYIVADLGNGINEATIPVIERADQIILCLRSERIALISARHLLKSLKEHTQNDIRLVLLDVDGGLPKDVVERYVGQPISAVIPYVKTMGDAVNKGVPFVFLYPKAPETVLFRQFVGKLVQAVMRHKS